VLLESCKRSDSVGGVLILAQPCMMVRGKGDEGEVGGDLFVGVCGALG